MNVAQIDALVKQYEQSSGSFDDFLKSYQALTSSNKTPLGLNRWASTDKPVMNDFNEDNRIIDEKLREMDAALTEKVDKSEVYTKDEVDTKLETCAGGPSGSGTGTVIRISLNGIMTITGSINLKYIMERKLMAKRLHCPIPKTV